MKSAAILLSMWLATLPTHRWLARHPDWDLPTDKGFRFAIASGRILLPVAALIAILTGQP